MFVPFFCFSHFPPQNITLCRDPNCFVSKHLKVYISDYIISSQNQINLIEGDVTNYYACASWWFYLGRKQAFEDVLKYIELKEKPEFRIIDGQDHKLITSLFD